MSDFAARGSQRELRYIAEVTPGTTPGAPSMTVLRATTDSLNTRKAELQSAELRGDRQIAAVRTGNPTVTGDIGLELSYGSQDAFLEALLFGAFAAAYNVTAQSITVDAGAKTFTRAAGSFLTDGVEVGDKITFSGFAEAGNNGTFIVTTVIALVVTCAAAAGLVNEAGGGDEAFTTPRLRLPMGTTLKTFTIEKAHLDIDVYQVFRGVIPSSLRLSVQPGRMITGSFGMVGMAGDEPTGAALDATPTAAPTSQPFDSYTGSIKEGGAAIAIATGLELVVDNGMEAKYRLFSTEAGGLLDKRANVTGTLTAWFQDSTLLAKFLAETESSLQFTLTDLDGNSYRFTFPRIKYSTGDTPVQGEGEVSLSMSWRAILDSTTGTNMIVDKIPA